MPTWHPLVGIGLKWEGNPYDLWYKSHFIPLPSIKWIMQFSEFVDTICRFNVISSELFRLIYWNWSGYSRNAKTCLISTAIANELKKLTSEHPFFLLLVVNCKVGQTINGKNSGAKIKQKRFKLHAMCNWTSLRSCHQS